MRHPNPSIAAEELLQSAACTLQHDGCVVCADAGISVRVISVEADDAVCEDAAGNRASIAIELVAPVRVGDVLLTHGGVAIGRADAVPAQITGGEDADEVR